MQSEQLIQDALDEFKKVELLPKAIRVAKNDVNKKPIFRILGPFQWMEYSELPNGEINSIYHEYIINNLVGTISNYAERAFFDFAYESFDRSTMDGFSLETLRSMLGGSLLDHNIIVPASILNDLRQLSAIGMVYSPVVERGMLEEGYAGTLLENRHTDKDRAVNILTDCFRYDTLRVVPENNIIVLPHELELNHKINADYSELRKTETSVEVEAQISVDIQIYGSVEGCKYIAVEK